MGYTTRFQFEIVRGDAEEWQVVRAALQGPLKGWRTPPKPIKAVSLDGEPVDVYPADAWPTSFDYLIGDRCKWYDWEANMRVLSKLFPDSVFRLDGEGEEAGDIWVAYFRNGEAQVFRAPKWEPPGCPF